MDNIGPYPQKRSITIDPFKHNNIRVDLDAYITCADVNFLKKIAPLEVKLSSTKMSTSVKNRSFYEFIKEHNLMLACEVAGNTRVFIKAEFELEIRKLLGLYNIALTVPDRGSGSRFKVNVFSKAVSSIASSLLATVFKDAGVSEIYLYNYGSRIPVVDPVFIPSSSNNTRIGIDDFSPEIKLLGEIESPGDNIASKQFTQVYFIE